MSVMKPSIKNLIRPLNESPYVLFLYNIVGGIYGENDISFISLQTIRLEGINVNSNANLETSKLVDVIFNIDNHLLFNPIPLTIVNSLLYKLPESILWPEGQIIKFKFYSEKQIFEIILSLVLRTKGERDITKLIKRY